MLSKRSLSIALAATLSLPQFGFAATAEGPATKLIFPGDPLPKELGFSPLKVGSTYDSEVQVMARDWFLLKDKGMVLLNPVMGKTLDLNGPVLEPSNTQIYFRIMSGIVLKEAMVQLGMNAGQAKRYIEKAGEGFESVSLAELGELPKGLDYLYTNWDRPTVRMALLPNVMLPLAVAYDQSQLQHFAKAGLNDTDSGKACSTIATAAPIGPVQEKIEEKQKQLDGISTELRNAQARLVQSKAEQKRLNDVLKSISTGIDAHMTCFNVIKNRVSRGGTMPDQDCLNKAATLMGEAQLSTEWTKFVGNNLKNDQGDETVAKQKETEVRALEARVAETQNIVRQLQEQEDKAKQEQVSATEKLGRLNEIYGPEKSKVADLDNEALALKAELESLQTIDYKLKIPSRQDMSEEDVKKAIAATPEREKRIAWIETRAKQIVPEQVKRQAYQGSILTQIQSVSGTIDEKKAQIATLDRQLNAKPDGYVGKLEELKAQLAVETPKFIKINDDAKFSDYVVSVLMKKLATMGQTRDAQYNSIKDEEARAEKYQQEIEAAAKDKDARYDGIAAEVVQLQTLIASYRDVAQMGWFLETDCGARNSYTQAPGIYLSRAKIDSVSKDLPTTPVDGGKWGLFNLDYAHFQAPIQSGILLNVPAYVQMAVQQILENYDFAVTQSLDPQVVKCGDDAKISGSSAAVLGMMGKASAIWSDGADAQAKTNAFKCGMSAMAAVTPAQAAPVATVTKYVTKVRQRMINGVLTNVNVRVPVKVPVAAQSAAARTAAVTRPTVSNGTFQASLLKLANFNGSVLDAALPQSGQAHPVDLIERNAISLLGQEIGLLAGSVRAETDLNAAHARRDRVIKAMLRVLAYDYESEIAKQTAIATAKNQTQYIFATNPPVKVAAVGGLQANNNYYVKTLGSVHLYTQPIAKPAYDAGVAVSLNDIVKVLPIDGSSSELVRGGWVKIQGAKGELWMPAWPLTSTIVDEGGQEVQGMASLQNCAHPKIVLNLQNFAGNRPIVRFASNVTTKEAGKKAGWFVIDEGKTPMVPVSAFTNRTYIACETLQVQDQPAMVGAGPSFENMNGVDFTKTIAIRIVEAKPYKAANGKVIYLPTETEGGFVSTWQSKGRSMAPRISLGVELDPTTWSIR